MANPITYRDLRNTPAKVFERLATGEPLALVSDGTTKALLIPVDDGDVTTVLDAWTRGRALLALARVQSGARAGANAAMSLTEISREVELTRKSRSARETQR